MNTLLEFSAWRNVKTLERNDNVSPKKRSPANGRAGSNPAALKLSKTI